MSDFFSDQKVVTARKDHRCTYCGESISKGEKYTYQQGNWNGRWFESKMHNECFADLCESGDGEYTPYSNERPTKDEVGL